MPAAAPVGLPRSHIAVLVPGDHGAALHHSDAAHRTCRPQSPARERLHLSFSLSASENPPTRAWELARCDRYSLRTHELVPMVRGEEDHVLLVHQEEPEEGDAALGVSGGNPASRQGAGAEAAGDVELQPRHSPVRATDDVETEDATGTAGLHAQRASACADFSGAAGSPWLTKARAWAQPHARAAWAWAVNNL